jgi:hypothetical protein
MLGRDAASQIAAASVASFLPLLPSMRYGETKLAAISRASMPMERSLRAQWCATAAGLHRDQAPRKAAAYTSAMNLIPRQRHATPLTRPAWR